MREAEALSDALRKVKHHRVHLEHSISCRLTSRELCTFSLHYCYVKITIFHPVVSKIKLRFYLKPGNREPMFECWDESGSEHPDMVPHRGVWSRGNTHRILWRQYFSMLLCTGSEDHSANLSQFLLAQRCVPPDCGVGDYPHVFLNQVIRDPCLGESCD